MHRAGIRSTSGVNCKFDETVEIYGKPNLKDSIFRRFSRVSGSSDISDSCVDRFATIAGNSHIFKSYVGGNSLIDGGKESTLGISQSYIFGNSVICDKPIIVHSTIQDYARVYDNPVLISCYVSDFVEICGDAKIVGSIHKPIELNGYCYVHRGEWNRAPLHAVEPDSGRIISECTDDHYDVGCRCDHIDRYFTPAYRRYGKLTGLTDTQMDNCLKIIERMQRHKEKYLCNAT